MAWVSCSATDCTHNKYGACDLIFANVDECCDFARDDTIELHKRELVKLRLWNNAILKKEETKL